MYCTVVFYCYCIVFLQPGQPDNPETVLAGDYDPAVVVEGDLGGEEELSWAGMAECSEKMRFSTEMECHDEYSHCKGSRAHRRQLSAVIAPQA